MGNFWLNFRRAAWPTLEALNFWLYLSLDDIVSRSGEQPDKPQFPCRLLCVFPPFPSRVSIAAVRLVACLSLSMSPSSCWGLSCCFFLLLFTGFLCLLVISFRVSLLKVFVMLGRVFTCPVLDWKLINGKCLPWDICKRVSCFYHLCDTGW